LPSELHIKILSPRLPLRKRSAKDPTTSRHGTPNGHHTKINTNRLREVPPNSLLGNTVENGDLAGVKDGLHLGLQVDGDGTNMSGRATIRNARPVECAKEAVLLNIRLKR